MNVVKFFAKSFDNVKKFKQICEDIECQHENLPGVVDNYEDEKERIMRICGIGKILARYRIGDCLIIFIFCNN